MSMEHIYEKWGGLPVGLFGCYRANLVCYWFLSSCYFNWVPFAVVSFLVIKIMFQNVIGFEAEIDFFFNFYLQQNHWVFWGCQLV